MLGNYTTDGDGARRQTPTCEFRVFRALRSALFPIHKSNPTGGASRVVLPHVRAQHLNLLEKIVLVCSIRAFEVGGQMR